jgi:bifunctional non-homologous end joining protein LigD
MLLHQGRKTPPFNQPGWLYEIKYDGYRLVAGIDAGTAHLNSRSGMDVTKWFPEITEALATIPGGPHVLDGEVCVLDDIGRSDFDRLQVRARKKRWWSGCDPVVFCAFDLLAQDGRSLISLPVEARKLALRKLIPRGMPSVLYVGHFESQHGANLYAQAQALKLEGLVAKRSGSIYVPGVRSSDWIKCKVPGAIPAERFKHLSERR